MMKPAGPHDVRVVLRRDLIERGWHDRAIARMLSSGTWVRVRHGAYADAAEWKALDEPGRHLVRTRAVLRQARTDVVVSHAAALPLYDAPTWGMPLDAVDLTRRDGRVGRKEAGVRQHRGRILDGDVVERHGIAVMSPTRTALEVTTCADVEAALAVVNHFLNAGLTDEASIEERYRSGKSPIERWSGTLNTDLVLRLARPAIESVGESRAFYLCFTAHLPLPIPQFEIRDATGKVVHRVDFAWPDLGVYVEFDGLVKYRKPFKAGMTPEEVVIAEKRREDLICRLTGWRCLRLTWADLAHPVRTAAMIAAFLRGLPTVA